MKGPDNLYPDTLVLEIFIPPSSTQRWMIPCFMLTLASFREYLSQHVPVRNSCVQVQSGKGVIYLLSSNRLELKLH